MTRVKVCGITRMDDALLAAELGAFAVGFVFWSRSPRFIDPIRAREITVALPAHIGKVGVFVNQPVDEVAMIAAATGLTAVQLHGEEPAADADRLGLPVIKAVAVDANFSISHLDRFPEPITVLLDAHDPERRGGTGVAIDWSIAATAAARRKIVLAGGLRPENIRAAIEQVSPYAVDVSSGIELSPGVKDPGRLRALFEALSDD